MWEHIRPWAPLQITGSLAHSFVAIVECLRASYQNDSQHSTSHQSSCVNFRVRVWNATNLFNAGLYKFYLTPTIYKRAPCLNWIHKRFLIFLKCHLNQQRQKAVNNSIKRLNSQNDHPDLSSTVLLCRHSPYCVNERNLFRLKIGFDSSQSPECSSFFLGLQHSLEKCPATWKQKVPFEEISNLNFKLSTSQSV